MSKEEECPHSHYAAGHCAEMSCWNYYSRCLRHCYSGRVNATCTRVHLDSVRVKYTGASHHRVLRHAISSAIPEERDNVILILEDMLTGITEGETIDWDWLEQMFAGLGEEIDELKPHD